MALAADKVSVIDTLTLPFEEVERMGMVHATIEKMEIIASARPGRTRIRTPARLFMIGLQHFIYSQTHMLLHRKYA